MNISSLIQYFASADSTGKSGSKIDTQLEYNMLGQFLSGEGYIVDNEEAFSLSHIKNEEKEQLQNLYNGLKNSYNTNIGKINIIITDDNAKQYTRVLQNFLMLDKYSDKDEECKDSVNKIQKALYQYILDNNYDLHGLKEHEVNYDFVINDILQEKKAKSVENISDDTNINENDIEEDNFVPNKNLKLYQVDMGTIYKDPKDGMFAISAQGIKIVYDNKHYYSPDYPHIAGEKNLLALNFYINQEFHEKLENELSDIFKSNKSEKEKKEYLTEFIENVKKWAYNADKQFIYENGIMPGKEMYAKLGAICIPFIVGNDLTPQFNMEAIYSDFQKKYANQ